jgi:hypothetical protein
MHHIAFVMLSLIWSPNFVTVQEKDAKGVAQELLNKGALLFDKHDAAAMAETYADNARVTWVEKDKDTGKYKFETKDGRAEIEKLYRGLFENSTEKTTSRNTVEFAKFISSNLMVIEGTFEPKIDQGKYAFTQERVKQGDRWLIQTLRIYVVFPD